MCLADITDTTTYARVAQLVEHDLAKVGAAGSSPVSRSNIKKSDSKRNRSQTVDKVHDKCRGFFSY